jgi:hypothetical protein
MDKQVERFIADHVRPEYRPVAEALIALLESAAPELKPGMRGGTEMYIPVPVWRMTHDLVVLSPSQRGITISFANGAQFDNAARLLRGTGKKSRTVLLRRIEDVGRPEMVGLFRQAVALGG